METQRRPKFGIWGVLAGSKRIYVENAAEWPGQYCEKSFLKAFRGNLKVGSCQNAKNAKFEHLGNSRGRKKHLRAKCCRMVWSISQTELCKPVLWRCSRATFWVFAKSSCARLDPIARLESSSPVRDNRPVRVVALLVKIARLLDLPG